MIRYIRRFILYISIIILLALMRICILIIPFRIIAKRLTIVYTKTTTLNEHKRLGYALLIGRTISKISQKTPWQSKCLVQALVAKILLRRFKITNNLVIGVGFDTGSEFIAHAWVDVGGITIVGETKKNLYKSIKSFADTNSSGNCYAA